MSNTESIKPPKGTNVSKLDLDMEFNTLMDEVAEMFKQKQYLRNWNQELFVSKVPIARSTLLEVLSGKGNPTVKSVLAIAMALGYKIEINLVRK